MPATSAKAPVTIRMDLAQCDALDARFGRDRSHVVNEAVQAWPELQAGPNCRLARIAGWLELQAWQEAHIREGLAQADAGSFAAEAEVEAERLAAQKLGMYGQYIKISL